MQTAILHHGTLLYDFDAGRVELFLKPPLREPSYRAGRSHRDFLGNLPLRPEEIRRRLREALYLLGLLAAPAGTDARDEPKQCCG
jgi:lipoate-protein ligase A